MRVGQLCLYWKKCGFNFIIFLSFKLSISCFPFEEFSVNRALRTVIPKEEFVVKEFLEQKKLVWKERKK